MSKEICKLKFELHRCDYIHQVGRDGGMNQSLPESVDDNVLNLERMTSSYGTSIIKIKNFRDGNMSSIKIEEDQDGKKYCIGICASDMSYCELLERKD